MVSVCVSILKFADLCHYCRCYRHYCKYQLVKVDLHFFFCHLMLIQYVCFQVSTHRASPLIVDNVLTVIYFILWCKVKMSVCTSFGPPLGLYHL